MGHVYYVGIGTLDRPWQFNNRQEDHKEWLRLEIEGGRRMDLIVEIVMECSSREEALKEELTLIDKHRPVFNRNYRKTSVNKLTDEDVETISKLREQGLSYSEISKVIGVSTMSVYRCFNGITKSYMP